MATRADLFKYRHSRGRKLDPLSGRLATKEREHSSLIINDELFISHWIFLIPNNSKLVIMLTGMSLLASRQIISMAKRDILKVPNLAKADD